MLALTSDDSHHGPGHPRNPVGERDGRDLRWPPRQQCRESRPMLGPVDLGIADNGERTGHKQAAQIAAPCLLIPPSLFLPPLECCFGICGMPPANVAGVSTTATLIFCIGGNDGNEVRHSQTIVEH
jgi:hypothetical protein